MKAIVCDKCGKVILLPDEPSALFPRGTARLIMVGSQEELDVCQECADELFAAVRKGK